MRKSTGPLSREELEEALTRFPQVQVSKMMEEPPTEMSAQSNKKIMRKLEIMRILVGKYLVLFRCACQYLREIEEIMNQP
jgi:hypothetical protein